MNGKISLLTTTLLCTGLSTGAFFLGKFSSSDSHETQAPSSEQADKDNSRSSNLGSRSRSNLKERSVAGRALREMREQGADAAIEQIFAITDPLKRGDALRKLLDQMPAEDFTAFIDAFRKSGLAREHMGDYRMALYSWAQKDPITALNYAEENTRSRWTRQTLVSAWAQYDPDAAEMWAQNNYDGEGANPWIVGVIDGVVSTDLDSATRLLNTMPFSEERGDALEKVMPFVSKLDFDESIAWLNSITEERLLNGATRRLAGRLGESDPEAAIAWAETIDDENRKISAIAQITESWVSKDVEASVAYVENLPQESQLTIARNFVQNLGQQDFDRASSWLDSLGSDPRVDEAKMALGWTSLRGENRDKAMEIFQTIADSNSPQAKVARRTIRRMQRARGE